jgi:hypothetical protein
MSLEPITDPEAVPLGLLRRYLTAHGWRQGTVGRRSPPAHVQNEIMAAFLQARPGGRRNFDVYVLSEDGFEDVELVLPREQTASDFLRRIEGAIRTLSDIEGREPEQVITDVRMIGYDVVRSRIPDMMVHDDTIYLEVAANYITSVKSLLAATATTEIQPDPYFLRVRKEASEYADRCRFAHTFRGSFGFSIESPIVPNNEPTLPQIDQPRPFERRVMERFARGVQAVCDAVASDTTARIVTSVQTGFSANACELFADLIENTSPGGLILSFAFSPEWRSDDELVKASSFAVGPRHVEVTRTAAKELRHQIQPRAEKIFGRVTRLESEADPSDLLHPMGDREIAIQWASEDMDVGDVLVRVSLSPADYLRAHAAHGAGRPVMVSGTLERKGRRWVLTNPTDFRVP